MIHSHHQKKIILRLRQREDFVIVPLGFRRRSLHQIVVEIECGISGIGARQGFAYLFEMGGQEIGVAFPARTPYNGHKITAGQADRCPPIQMKRRTL